ncbi:MAG TPA: MFS transporter [Candidatus Limiplasma stercoravium]|nr:MFS transporter [Candidatus Limiplasma stercoravium]
MKLTYRHTILACYLGSATQATTVNFAPLLFLTFRDTFQIPLAQITLMVTVTFVIQLLVDLLGSRYADRIGYRRCVVFGALSSFAGLVGLGTLPFLLPHPYAGLMISVVLYSLGAGINEVLVSPIVEACPTPSKAAAMSLLHSFYCWGCVATILLSTVFFACFGLARWPVLALLWALVPLTSAVLFALVPINTLEDSGEKSLGIRHLCRNPLFWVMMLIMALSGASELSMSQWSSSFAQSALGVSKAVGDLAGPCAFAVLMGTARVILSRARWPLSAVLMGSAVLCVAAYLMASLTQNPVVGLAGCALCGFAVGSMWPTTISLGTRICPGGGTALFALFALGGDLGCTAGPTLVGAVADAFGESLQAGLLTAAIFPTLMLVAVGCLAVKNKRGKACAQG